MKNQKKLRRIGSPAKGRKNRAQPDLQLSKIGKRSCEMPIVTLDVTSRDNLDQFPGV